MATKTRIRLTKGYDGENYDIVLNYDDATAEVTTEAAIQLVSRHRLIDGDTLDVETIEVGE